MIHFFDASALVKRYVSETGSENELDLDAAFAAEGISDGTFLELRATLQ